MCGTGMTLAAIGLMTAASPALAQRTSLDAQPLAGDNWHYDSGLRNSAMGGSAQPLVRERIEGLLENGKVDAALARLQPLAAAGDAWAQWTLGSIKLKRGEAGALHWIEEAATQGHAEAALVMGTAYATGEGMARDAAIARGWLLLAARRGDRTVIRDAHKLMRTLPKPSSS
jgi:TPR repeat protein